MKLTEDAEKLVSRELGIAEVLLTPQSSLINATIEKVAFREKYNLNIIGVNRKGQYVLENMSNVKLRVGDAVQGAWPDIEMLAKETQDVVVVGQPQEQASMAAASGKAPIAGVIMLMMLILMTFEIVPAVTAVIIAASMAFATPFASPTNALVMTAGGYKFSDFVKIGVPLQLILFFVMLFAIPFFFPF